MVEPAILERLRTLVVEAAEATDGDVEGARLMENDSFLPDYLDSIGLITLIGMTEDQWSIRFEDEELEPEVFESVAALGSLVALKRGELSA